MDARQPVRSVVRLLQIVGNLHVCGQFVFITAIKMTVRAGRLDHILLAQMLQLQTDGCGRERYECSQSLPNTVKRKYDLTRMTQSSVADGIEMVKEASIHWSLLIWYTLNLLSFADLTSAESFVRLTGVVGDLLRNPARSCSLDAVLSQGVIPPVSDFIALANRPLFNMRRN